MMSEPQPTEFEKAARDEPQKPLLVELWGFFRQNKKWWLMPIVLVILLLGVLIMLGGSALAPFLYTLF
jgi:hypothetical protein